MELLGSRMSVSELYVNSLADSYVKNILLQLNVIDNAIDNIYNDLHKMTYKKAIKKENRSDAVALSKKCSSYAQELKKIIMNFSNKYNDDKINFAIVILNDRISALEKKIDGLSVN